MTEESRCADEVIRGSGIEREFPQKELLKEMLKEQLKGSRRTKRRHDHKGEGSDQQDHRLKRAPRGRGWNRAPRRLFESFMTADSVEWRLQEPNWNESRNKRREGQGRHSCKSG